MRNKYLPIRTGKAASSLSADGERALHVAIAALEDQRRILREKSPADGNEAFKLIKGSIMLSHMNKMLHIIA